MVCFMVGSDPEKYQGLVPDTELPEYRQTECVYEWKNMAWSWDAMLKPHLRSADQPKVTIKVEYQEKRNSQSTPGPCATWACSKPSPRMRQIVTRGLVRSPLWRAHAERRMPDGQAGAGPDPLL